VTEKFDLSIERTLDAPRDLVWKAWTSPKHIKRWWAPRPYQTPEVEIELEPGGKFYTRMTGPDGFDFSGTACVLEVVPNERIVYVYDMYSGDTQTSVSLVTISLQPSKTGTDLLITEQGVFLDGHDDPRSREHGTNVLIDQLERSLQRPSG